MSGLKVVGIPKEISRRTTIRDGLVSPQKIYWSSNPRYVRMWSFFENMVVANVIKLIWGHMEGGWALNPRWLVSLKEEEMQSGKMATWRLNQRLKLRCYKFVGLCYSSPRKLMQPASVKVKTFQKTARVVGLYYVREGGLLDKIQGNQF